MSLHVLVIIDRNAPHSVAEWYFDSHAHFLRARKRAQELGIFITDRTDFICDLDEFEGWVRENFKQAEAG